MSTRPPQSTRPNTRGRPTTSVRQVAAKRSKPSPRRTWIPTTSHRCSNTTMTDDMHGPNHVGTGCSTCDEQGGQPPAAGPRLATVKLAARGEEFRIVQLRGQLMVCAKQHGSCCCGWDEKGRMPFDPQVLWADDWERRKIRNKVHLSFTGCLGPCAVGNNALLQLFGQSIWFKDLNGDQYIPMIFDYIETMLNAGQTLPPPENLANHVYARYLPPPALDRRRNGDGQRWLRHVHLREHCIR